jgi:tetratricopeptide (TPR) repeat protein
MKIFFTLFFSCIFFSVSFSQSNSRDSIRTMLLKETSDTGRVLQLINLSAEYLGTDPDSTMILALQALEISRKVIFEKGEAESLNRIAEAYQRLGNYVKAMEVVMQALTINERIRHKDGIHRSQNIIGNFYAHQEDYRTALQYYFQAKGLAEEMKNSRSLCVYQRNIGEAYLHLGIYDSASIFVEKSFHLAHKLNHYSISGGSYNLLGKINMESGKNSLALEFLRLSIPLLEASHNLVSLSEAYLNTAQIFKILENHDSVIYYGTKARIVASQLGYVIQLRDAARFLSHYYRKHNADSAFFYQDLSISCNNTLFNKPKQQQMQNLSFNDRLRQQEMVAAEIMAKKELKYTLQTTALAIGMITFLIFFIFLSHSILANQQIIRYLGIVVLLIVFEFLNLSLHAWLVHITDHSPILMLLIMVGIAALLVPLHHKLEHWVSHKLVEKNNRIRLMAAKKTIEKLEGNRQENNIGKNESHREVM